MKKILLILFIINYNLLLLSASVTSSEAYYNPDKNVNTPHFQKPEAPIKEATSRSYRKYILKCKEKIEEEAALYLSKDPSTLVSQYACISYFEWQQNNKTLIKANENGEVEIVKQLLESDQVDVNAKNDSGMTALMYASLKGFQEIAQLLLAKEDININTKDNDGWTALMWASQKGFKEIVQLLLTKEDIDVNAKDSEGMTALMWASQKGFKEIVQLLLAKENIDINAKDYQGWTAARWSSFPIVQLLKHKKSNNA